MGLLRVLDGRELDGLLTQAGKLLATLVGQDLDEGADGVFTIARRVAKDAGDLYRGSPSPPWA